jgi:hypothetical protein
MHTEHRANDRDEDLFRVELIDYPFHHFSGFWEGVVMENRDMHRQSGVYVTEKFFVYIFDRGFSGP